MALPEDLEKQASNIGVVAANVCWYLNSLGISGARVAEINVSGRINPVTGAMQIIQITENKVLTTGVATVEEAPTTRTESTENTGERTIQNFGEKILGSREVTES